MWIYSIIKLCRALRIMEIEKSNNIGRRACRQNKQSEKLCVRFQKREEKY